MKKKIFTMGKVYDLGTLGVNEVENAVQADLDRSLMPVESDLSLEKYQGKHWN